MGKTHLLRGAFATVTALAVMAVGAMIVRANLDADVTQQGGEGLVAVLMERGHVAALGTDHARPLVTFF